MKQSKIPHTYVIIFFIIVLAAVLTWLIPGGEYERETVNVSGMSREVIKANSFQFTESNPQTWQIFSSLYEGFVDKADIIVFILIIGGAFWIMNESKAIDVGILSFLSFTKRLKKISFFRSLGVDNLIIVFVMLIFSVFGATFGMSEETIAFVIIFVPLSISMGYDSIIGVSMCFVAAGLGFAGAILNPFTIGVAQGLSNLPLFSGIEYRLFCWVIINIVGIGWVLMYASKIRKNPKKSPVYEEDEYWRQKESIETNEIGTSAPKITWGVYGITLSIFIAAAFLIPFTTLTVGNSSITAPVFPILSVIFALSGWWACRKSMQFFILILLLFTILLLIVGVMGYGWYIMEIATLFFVMGILCGIAMNKSPNEITHLFINGVKDILSAALVVGLAGGIIFVLENGNIIDTMLYYISRSMSDFGQMASVGMMYVFQTLINIIIPSGSAKAALTIPMMSQFSDLIGVSRQATVMAFQLGDGFTNMITPTSGVLIGVLGVARIPFDKWLRWVTPFVLILAILGFLLLIPTVYMDLNGF
jgi:uncharacterized ion transporter superfamily protein YfcC